MNDHNWIWYINCCLEGESEWIILWLLPTRKEARALVKELKKDDRKFGFKHRYRIGKEERL